MTGVSAVFTTVIQLVQTLVLARLLGPEQFGLMAMVLMVVLFGDLFGQMGLNDAIIPRKDVSRAELSSLYWFSIAWGGLIYLIIYTLTPLIALGFSEPQLKTLLPVTLISIVITPFGTQFFALLQKSLKFHLLASVEIASALLGLFVAVASAWIWDQGVWALVWGHLSRNTAGTIVFMAYGWLVGPRPRLHFATADLHGFLRFGLYRVAANGANFVVSRVDQILIGSLLGAQALGFYSMAANITLLPIQKISPVIAKVAFPVFAKIQDDIPLLKRGYMELLKILTFINAPVLIGMAVIAPIAVPVLLGEQWTESVLLIQILAIYALLRSVGNASGSLIMGLGRADITFFWNLGLLFAVPPVVYVASLTGSITNVAWSMVLLQAILYVALYAMIVRRLLGPCPTPFFSAFAGPVSLALAMGAIVIAMDPLLTDFPTIVHLGSQVLIGVACYVSLTLIFQMRYLKQILRMVKGQPWNI